MYTNEFCGLRIQIPEGERIPETKIQEAKQKMEEILHYASFCAETMSIKNKIIVNISTTEEENVRHYLSVCIDKNNVFASSYYYDLNKKHGELIDEIKLEDVNAIKVDKTIEKINNFMRLKNFSLSQSAGIESLWEERISQILKERELTMDVHCDEYAKMQNISAKKNIQNKIPVQQHRLSSSNRPPSPVPVPPSVLKPLKQENVVSRHANRNENTPSNPDTSRREQFRQMIKTGDPEAIKKYMDMVKNCPQQQKSKQEKKNYPQRKASEKEGR